MNQALNGSKVRDKDVNPPAPEPKELPSMFIEPEDDEPPGLKKNPHYWDSPEPKFQASPSPESRNKAKAKRKAKKKHH